MSKKLREKMDIYADNGQWKQVADICLMLLEKYPDDLEVLYNISCAYYKLGQPKKVEKYCSIALSHPDIATVPVDRDLLEQFYDEISPHKYIPEVKKDFDSEYLFLPNSAKKENWMQQQHLSDIKSVLSGRECTFDFRKAKVFGTRCWDEVRYAKRHYQVSSNGRVEILASAELSQLIGLSKVRFIQEGATAPAVFLRFEFGEFSAIGVTKIKRNGDIVGFHEMSESSLFKIIIETTALAYYRDLVIPDPNVRYYHPSSTSKKRNRKCQTYKPKKPRELPRIQSASLSTRPEIYEFREWYYVQERARHYVDGHIRWVRPGFIADEMKQEQAWEAGVDLERGYTWVIEHERGTNDFTGPKLEKYDLVERTQFFSPKRASAELKDLFF